MKEVMRTTLGRLDDDLYELHEELMRDIRDLVVFEDEGEELMTVESMVIVIPELQIQLRCGTMYLYYEENEEYMADWSLTALYHIDADPGDYISYDQFNPIVSVYNYLHGKRTMDELDEIECVVKL